MKVLMISKACVRGSYQKKLEELAKFNDVELTVIVPPYWQERGQKIPLERSHTEGYELLTERMALNGHFHIHFYPNLGARVRQSNPQIIHIDEEPYNLATFQAMRLAKSVGAMALFFTWQNLLRRYPFPFRQLEKYNYRHAAHAIAGNREGVNVLRRKDYHGPVAVIPQFGVDPEIYKPSPPNASVPPSDYRIGYVGRLVEEKGVDLLLQAIAGLKEDWVLFILGDGPFKPQLERLTQDLGLGEKVRFESTLPSAKMPSFYNRLNVLVLPSRTGRQWKEQFGRVLIEGMACGIPVVGSDSGEIPQVIGEAGLIFPEGDKDALRAHLELLIRDRKLASTLVAKGRQRVTRKYTQKQIAKETHDVYVNMMQNQS